MADTNGVAAANKIIWWVLGIGGSIAVMFVSLLIGKLDVMGQRLNSIETKLASKDVQILHLELLANQTREEQLRGLMKWSEHQTRLSTIEQILKSVQETR